MATTFLSGITGRGVLAKFIEAIGSAPNIWQKHCLEIPSTTAEETHAWMGFLPVPREFVSGRNIQGVRDFTMTLTNKTYEMSVLFNRETVEDDSTNEIGRALREVAERWAMFKDSLFATLLVDGETSTDTFDGVAFHDASRTIGSSATIDNISTAAITLNTNPSATEILTALKEILEDMERYEDDQGSAGYNSRALQQIRCIIPPEFKRAFVEAINSTVISQSDNPWGKNLVDFDVLPQLTTSDVAFYTSATAVERKPFIIQERIPLEVQIYNSAADIALNDGLLMLSRERFRFGYGEPRRNFRYDFTTS